MLVLLFSLGVVTFSSLEYYFETSECMQDENKVWRYVQGEKNGEKCTFQVSSLRILWRMET
jgi:hypothetical protein